MVLRDRASSALDEALTALSAAHPGPLYESVAASRAALDAPMRVAIVGRIKAGKSTMMNALLGGEIAPTGPDELTYNVNTFVHADTPGLVVHFKDRRPPQSHPLSWLGMLVDRTRGDPATLRTIAHVEVGLPRKILERLELIDTPGFGSFFDTDSRNTLAFLGLSADDVDGITREQALGADAVAYLFARGIAASDRDLVADFEGASIGDFTPVNAIAVLTKADAYWSADSPDDDPLATARQITARIQDEPGVDRIFFEVLAVSGLLACGAATISGDDIESLTGLAKLPPPTLAKRLKNAARFVSAAYADTPVTPAQRASLFTRLGQYGIWVASGLIRDEGAGEAELPPLLLAASGLDRVQDVLLAHFADRATLIKAGTAINRSRALCSRAAQDGDTHAAEAAARLEAFELNEHAIAELALLRRLYRDDAWLGLSAAEMQELITVCGEHGGSCSARLGLPADASIPQLRRVVLERVTYWRERADEFGIASDTIDAIREIRRSYEVVAHHVARAHEHLEMTT